ncbi:hypothetical protein [Ornithinimicrobium kibberense]|uniref:hypothetical protein n=1 Tax=Ornithinimicrobium kibberense TaxID=282060 RepID=UPI0036142D8D
MGHRAADRVVRRRPLHPGCPAPSPDVRRGPDPPQHAGPPAGGRAGALDARGARRAARLGRPAGGGAGPRAARGAARSARGAARAPGVGVAAPRPVGRAAAARAELRRRPDRQASRPGARRPGRRGPRRRVTAPGRRALPPEVRETRGDR